MKSACKPVVLVVGTRPEGIKMIPVYLALKKAGIPTLLCSTMQHTQLLSEVFDIFGVTPDFVLNVMRMGQDLFYVTQSILQKSKELFLQLDPAMVLVHGDTTTTMASAMAAFYLKIPVGHVEAGLRTDTLLSPFPEEMNRRVTATLSGYHFAPTAAAMANLLAQGVQRSHIFCVGNTVVDALRLMRTKIDQQEVTVNSRLQKLIQQCKKQKKKILLLTAHRRESFDGGLVQIFSAIKERLQKDKNLFCFYPYHPNPNVIKAMHKVGLATLDNIALVEPVPYQDMINVMLAADVVITDSGGLQEEAVSLGKSVLVLRETTERAEGMWAGLAHLVGTDKDAIITALDATLKSDLKKSVTAVYGDGYAAEKIATIVAGVAKKTVVSQEKKEIAVHSSAVQLQKKDMAMKKVCVVGLGYIGLPTSIVAAEHGLEVVGFDIDHKKVTAINAGDPVIEEPEIFEKLQLVLQAQQFKAVTQLEQADYFVIAVPTPFKDGKKADLSYVFDATDNIAKVLKKGDTVIVESTIPVGTTQKVAEQLQAITGLQSGKDFFVAHCPERVLPGKIFKELIENARIIGGVDKVSVQKAKELYKYFVRGPLYLTDATTAEMVKLVENSSRDAQIAFAHQVTSMSYAAGLNPYEVIELANKHPRVNILQPSCGVGGHCIAVDPWFLVETFGKHASFLKAARDVNDHRPQEVMNIISNAVDVWTKEHNKKPTVLLFGLTYKPNVDDVRESPALHIAQTLMNKTSIDTRVCEPHIKNEVVQKLLNTDTVSITEGVEAADIIVYLVAHDRFKAIDQKLLQGKKMLDFCGLLHEPKQETVQQEMSFWPASSTLDFFIANHNEVYPLEKKDESKEHNK